MLNISFIVGQASQPIADLMPVNRLRGWPNANLTLGLLYTLRHNISKHMAFTLCCFNVEPQYSKLAHIKTALGDCPVFAGTETLLYAGDAFARRQKTKITRYIGPMLM